MNGQSYTYTFFGKVFPERANVKFSQLENEMKWNDNKINGVLSIDCSQIMAQYTCNSKIEDIYTFKNDIKEQIRSIVDIIGYTNGCGYDIEITSCVDSLDRQIVFGVNIADTEKFSEKRPHKVNDLFLILSSSEYQICFRRCLADLREAIRSPKDTGFFCYRGLESLRQFFANKHDLSDGKSWEKFRDELDVEMKKIIEIKKYADPVRHGGNISISSEERYKIVESTWEIVDKFIEYALMNMKK